MSAFTYVYQHRHGCPSPEVGCEQSTEDLERIKIVYFYMRLITLRAVVFGASSTNFRCRLGFNLKN